MGCCQSDESEPLIGHEHHGQGPISAKEGTGSKRPKAYEKLSENEPIEKVECITPLRQTENSAEEDQDSVAEALYDSIVERTSLEFIQIDQSTNVLDRREVSKRSLEYRSLVSAEPFSAQAAKGPSLELPTNPSVLSTNQLLSPPVSPAQLALLGRTEQTLCSCIERVHVKQVEPLIYSFTPVSSVQ